MVSELEDRIVEITAMEQNNEKRNSISKEKAFPLRSETRQGWLLLPRKHCTGVLARTNKQKKEIKTYRWE